MRVRSSAPGAGGPRGGRSGRPRRWTRRRALAAAGALVLGGCAAPRSRRPAGEAPSLSHTPPVYDPDWTAPTETPLASPASPTTVVVGLEIPWDVDFTPDGDAFITERVGRVNRYSNETLSTVLSPTEVIDAGSVEPGSDDRPWWVRGGEGGLMGVAVHPTYPEPPYVYVYYTARTWFGLGRANRLVRFDAGADDPAATETVLLDGVPAGRVHNGGRIAFGPEDYLWVTTGDAEMGERTRRRSQDLASLAGKVLRLRADGTAAPDNPDLGADADPRIYTYGHRNPQGIAWLPDGTPVVTEHGQGGFDEVSALEAGANYGWPDVRHPEGYRANPDVHRPILSTRTDTWAPSGAVFATGDAVPAWRGRLLVGGLVSQQVVVVTVARAGEALPPTRAAVAERYDADWFDSRYDATSHAVLADVLGRVRHVTEAPDGSLYAITSNRDGRAGEGFPREHDDVLVRLEA